MKNEEYFDIRHLAWSKGGHRCCPVTGCTSTLTKVKSQWGPMDYCPVHRIRIHANSQTFAYYDTRDAALRNILFERQYFKEHILGNPLKAETHRMGHETSEDALTWNVFSRLARNGSLPKLLSTLTNLDVRSQPELYLWGLRINLNDSSTPSQFECLIKAHAKFEKGINKFRTEPDIMLYVPNQLLVLIEAKFTSGNTIALDSTNYDPNDEKPKSREGILHRYHTAELPEGYMLTPPSSGPFYSQLYRNLVFAIWMANELKVGFGLVNLVGENQFRQRSNKVEYQDPTPFIHSLLPEKSRNQFKFDSWENLYAEHVVKDAKLNDLAEYMYNKSANGVKAFAI